MNTDDTDLTDNMSPTDKKEMAEMSLVDRLKEFMEYEARSCSMDPGCITPLYVYRMWGGSVALEEIERAMEEVRRKM